MKKLEGKWLAVGLLLAAGLVLRFAMTGCSVLALLCFGIAGLIVVFHLVGLLERRSKAGMVLRTILVVLLVVGVLATAATWSVIMGESKGIGDVPVSYIVVLGAQVKGTQPSLSMSERLDAAYPYLMSHPDVICVVSGGQGMGEEISEAQCMYEGLTDRGIAPDRIWLEDGSTNTLENLSRSLDVIQQKTGTRPERIGVVSSEYHLFRACAFARDAGVIPVGIPAKTTYPLVRLNYYLREVAAVWYYMLLGG